ncbi:hypothetical protein [Pseudoxanthomonas sp.]|uniref:hypothetical protein n=1 Tax=Pseudoxanthomonas sp. TaxID=1871049 RepID=UPI00258E1742|nr:hypothetical protein [Pseudoxanthomonas sp.]MCR6686139.1 hypothetical protein [Pseudoxanthomonas sp.]
MNQARHSGAAGGGFIGVGTAFVAIAASGQPALLGVGMAFLGLGIVFLARGRRTRC